MSKRSASRTFMVTSTYPDPNNSKGVPEGYQFRFKIAFKAMTRGPNARKAFFKVSKGRNAKVMGPIPLPFKQKRKRRW